jgi:glycerol-3-phosphate dehydrogenase
MTLSVIERACASGAIALNYAAMERYRITNNNVSGIWVRDLVNDEVGEIRSQIVINAAGPWCDHLNRNASLHPLNTGFARGAHIVTRALLDHYAVALPSAFQSDGVATRGHRHVFVIPWRNHSLIGTSYMESDQPSDSMVATEAEISQLIDSVNAGLPQAKLSRGDVLQSFAGYYPLQSASIKQGVYQGTGEYRLVDHALTDGTDGLVTALGAKFTTARRLGEMAAQLTEKKLGRTVCSKHYPTRSVRIQGGNIPDLAAFRRQIPREYAGLWSEPTCQYLISCYGSKIHEIAKLCKERPTLNRVLTNSRDTIAAQVVFAAQSESVVHLTDILFRRTDLCLLGDPGDPVLNDCAELTAAALGWTENRRLTELELVRTELARSIPAAPNE